MKASVLLHEDGNLRHKLRTVNDLTTHLRNREGISANYNIFLGAGASVTSGIPAASSLIEEWALEIYSNLSGKKTNSSSEAIEYFKSNHQKWYKPNNPYASLFEKKCDLPTQRRRFIEGLVDGKLPSIGYAYLTRLVESGFFNAVFTTNFDDLINEAFYQFSNIRPIMCAHDSSIKRVSITSSRPKVIKIHGDYLFDDIKNTIRETESLEKNTKDKLIEFCKEFGLIIVGYSGSDRSVMDVLDMLSKQDEYLNNGVYWCFREDDEIGPELQNLLWREKIYPVLIEGFDQLFSELHFQITQKRLDIESSHDNSKIKSTIKNILKDDFRLAEHEIIGEEISTIKNADSKREIFNFITNFSEEARKKSNISIADSRNLFAINNLIAKNELDEAYKVAEQDYSDANDDDVKPFYIQKIIDIFEKKGDTRSVLNWCDRLIECDKNNYSFHLQKSNFLEGDEKTEYLKETLERNTHSYQILNFYASSLISQEKTDPINKKKEASKIIDLLDKSISLEPSLSNSAWNEKYSILANQHNKDPNTDKEIQKLITNMESVNPNHSNTLSIKSKDTARKKVFPKMKSYIEDLKAIHEISSKEKRITISKLIANLVECLPDAEENEGHKEISKDFFENFLTKTHFQKEGIFYLYAAEYEIGLNRDTKKSKEMYTKAIHSNDADSFLEGIINFLSCSDEELIEPIENLLEENKYTFLEHRYHYYKSEILIQKSDYETARKHIERSFQKGGAMSEYLNRLSYVYLLEENYKAVIKMFEKYKSFEEIPDAEAFIINSYFSNKKLGRDFTKTKIQNLSAQSNSDDVKVAAFAILDHEQKAKNIIKKQIRNSFQNYFKFKCWPIIPNNWLDEINSSIFTRNDQPERIH
ncbi:hypothetical protein Mag101_02260 [Microbulbifer agarilyticus]|uniref:Uncharacterized protein n=1 Tax=Microbulbifer agarilyticus TaxID=260552 RepID=A0A1Q2M218_9GAMM|nr:SIR2 family protein [Microbulbifer agarilyticus]AQQ66598.1 hypothetical protein Mag101_02260 [Microbulbifer agarilyticus]